MEERIAVENHGHRQVDIVLALELEADFATFFVVKSLEPGFGLQSDAQSRAAPARTRRRRMLVFADDSFAARTIVHLSEPSSSRTAPCALRSHCHPASGGASSLAWSPS